MLKGLFLIILMAWAFECRANDLVTFINNSDGRLKCSVFSEGGYVPFIRLSPNQSKAFSNYRLPKKVRCSISIDHRSATALTYFIVAEYGEYELLKEYVDCSSCKNRDYRYGTIVVHPNGKAEYNKLK